MMLPSSARRARCTHHVPSTSTTVAVCVVLITIANSVQLTTATTQSCATRPVPSIKKITPRVGSINGGQQITIIGRNFAPNPLNPEEDGVGNTVQLLGINRRQEYHCQTHLDGTHTRQIVFYTPANMLEDIYEVQVTVDGCTYPPDICPDNEATSQDKCWFTATLDKTPTVSSVEPPSGSTEEFVKISGRIFSRYTKSDTLTINATETGITNRFERAYLGPQLCRMYGANGEPYEIEYTVGTYGYFKCIVGTVTPGSYRVSYTIEKDYGRSYSLPTSLRVSAAQVVHHYQLYPQIETMSSNVGSTAGGALLSLGGLGFGRDVTAVQANFGHSECVVKSISDNLLTCETPAGITAAGGLVPGDRGLTNEFWEDQTDIDALYTLTSSDAGYTQETLDDVHFISDNITSFVGKMKGFFVPPFTGDYRFMLYGTMSAKLYISNTVDLSTTTDWSTVEPFINRTVGIQEIPDEVDDASEMTMFERRPEGYYYEVHYAGAGISEVAIGIFSSTAAHNSKRVATARDEIQRVNVSSTVYAKSQTLDMSRMPEEDDHNNDNTFTLELDTPGEDAAFRFLLDGEKSEWVSVDLVGETQVLAALQGMNGIPSRDVEVNEQGGRFRITITSPRGTWDIGDDDFSVEGDGVEATISRDREARDKFTKFFLTYKEAKSQPIRRNFDASELREAVKDLLSVKCPPGVLDSGTTYWHEDYEPYDEDHDNYGRQFATTPDGLFEPFCGNHALKNPDFLFRRRNKDPDKKYVPIKTYKYMCFAYYGIMDDKMRIGYLYQGESAAKRIDVDWSKSWTTAKNRWHYRCIDIFTPLGLDPNSQVVLSKVSIFTVPGKDIYIDAVSFKTSDDPIVVKSLRDDSGLDREMRERRRIAPARARDVQVTDLENGQWDISVLTWNCVVMRDFGVLGADVNGLIRETQTNYPKVGGKFKLGWNGRTTSNISPSAELEEFQSAVESLHPTLEVAIERSGDCYGYKYDITWVNLPGEQPLMEIAQENLSGSRDPEVTVEPVQNGGQLWTPVAGDMTSQVYMQTQLRVSVNNVPALCVGDCSYTQEAASTPSFTAITPTSGSSGSSVTLTVSNHDQSDVTNNRLVLGDIEYTATSVTPTTAVFDLTEGQAGTHQALFKVLGVGYAAEDSSLQFTFTGSVSAVAPLTGGFGGGVWVTVEGVGFTSLTTVHVGDSGDMCDVMTFSDITLVCIMPGVDAGGQSTVTKTLQVRNSAGEVMFSDDFVYTQSATPIVNSIENSDGESVTMLRAEGGQVLTIIGSGLGTMERGANTFSSIGRVAIPTVSVHTDLMIILTTPALPHGVHDLLLHTPDNGYATDGSYGRPTFQVNFEINDITPSTCGRFGGCAVTMTGSGLVNSADNYEVTVAGAECEVREHELQDGVLVVDMPDFKNTHVITNDGVHSVNGAKYEWNPRSINIYVGDSIQWEWASKRNRPLNYSIQEAEGDTAAEPLPGGFSSGEPSQDGTFTAGPFMTEGIFYYMSPEVDSTLPGFHMRGMIIVEAEPPRAGDVTVFVNGIEANYNPSSRKKRSVSACNLTPQMCNIVPATTPFSVAITRCSTTVITSVQPHQGSSLDPLTITGTGFGNQECVTVHVHDKICNIQSLVTAGDGVTTLTCLVDTTASGTNGYISTDDPLGVGPLYDIQVRNGPTGLAVFQSELFIRANENKRFRILPHISSISPSSGSIRGGAMVTITGGGFEEGVTVVDFGAGGSCEIETLDYQQIVCRTSEIVGTRYVSEMLVYVYQYQSVCHDTTTNCVYTQDEDNTPAITTVTPTTITHSPTTLTITGRGFDSSGVTVTVGDDECTVDTSTATQVTCVLLGATEGTHDVMLTVATRGDPADTTPPTVTGVFNDAPTLTPTEGSTQGGTLLTIDGHGFSLVGDESTVTTVSVDGDECVVVTSTHAQLVCSTPAKPEDTYPVTVEVGRNTHDNVGSYTYSSARTPTVDSLSISEGGVGDEVVISGTLFSATPEDNTVTLVSAAGAHVSCVVSASTDTSVTCELSEAATGSYTTAVHVAGAGYADWGANSNAFTYRMVVDSITPNEGSHAGGLTITLAGSSLSLRAAITIDGRPCLDLQGTSTEMTCVTPSSVATAGTAAVDLTWDDGSEVLTFTYTDSATPQVTGRISPILGGSRGGTLITIPGAGFGSTTPVVTLIGEGESGVETACTVMTSSDTQIICEAGSHGTSEDATIRIVVPDRGLVVADAADVQYSFVDLWSSDYTWGAVEGPDGRPMYSSGGKPQPQDVVSIPTGQTVVLDEDTPQLKMVLINGGRLIFSDDTDVTLKAENILITSGGLLQIGTEDEPYQHNAVIELHGHLRAPELPIFGAKTLGVREGALEIHGKPMSHTWTLLASTAEVGDSVITVQDDVDWSAGDLIVIATTGTKDSINESELREIVSVSGRDITLNDTLEYKHMGISETHDTQRPVTIEIRAEVIMLTRNVKIRGVGDPDYEEPIVNCPEDEEMRVFATQTCHIGRNGDEIGSDMFGAAIMIAGAESDTQAAVAHLENLEVTYAGQAYRLGRYPIHFHRNGDLSGSYVKTSSIWHTFNRGLNIHDTHNILVERNVFYDTMGGTIFLEDGIETGNEFNENVLIKVQASGSLLTDDVTPAAFWMTHPYNHFRRNRVAGGTHFAFWARFHEHPDGPSYDPSICPQNAHTGDFEGNVAHSMGWYGLWVFEDYFPTLSGNCQNKNNPEPWGVAVYNTLTAWNCKRGAEVAYGTGVQFHNFVLANNHFAGTEALFVHSGTPKFHDTLGHTWIDNTIIAHFDYEGHAPCTARGTVMPFDDGHLEIGTHFINFDGEVNEVEGLTCAAIGMVEIICTCVTFCGGYEYHFRDIYFENSIYKSQSLWSYQHVLVDEDGSLTGLGAGATALTESGLNPDDCVVSPEWSIPNQFNGQICPPGHNFARMTYNKFVPEHIKFQDFQVFNDYGEDITSYNKQRSTNNEGHIVVFPMGGVGGEHVLNIQFPDASQIVNSTYKATVSGVGVGDDVIICHSYLREGPFDQVEIYEDVRVNESEVMLTYAGNNDGDWFYETLENNDDYNARLCYILKGTQEEEDLLEVEEDLHKRQKTSPAAVKCLYHDCIVPDPNAEPLLPGEFYLYSDDSIWNTEDGLFTWTHADSTAGTVGLKPAENSIVTVAEGAWLRLDMNPPTLYKLLINGAFDVLNQPDVDFTIRATYIVVDGIMNIGTPEEVFTGRVTIEMDGDPTTPDYRSTVEEDLDGPFIGSKALAVYGLLQMNGVGPSVYWTRLATIANAGATLIQLQQEVDWSVGDQLVIATTSYDATETEIVTITAVSGDTLGIDPPLQHHHSGGPASGTETVDGMTYMIAAEVAVLTRRIVYKSVEEEDVTSFFGARILIGLKTDLAAEIPEGKVGNARISNVEFAYTGQEGFTTLFDPRFSIAFLDTGAGGPEDLRPSYLRGNSFHHGFATAIGVIGCTGVIVEDNVIHRTVGPAIQARGTGFQFLRNLVTSSMYVGTWGGRTNAGDYNWPGAFELVEAADYALIGNVVAGSERAAYRIDGEVCSGRDGYKTNDVNDPWVHRDNTGHSVFGGVIMFMEDSIAEQDCVLIRNYFIYKCYQYAFYYTGPKLVQYDSIIVADSHIGVLNMITYPQNTLHETEEKPVLIENSLFVGQSPAYECDYASEYKITSLLIESFKNSFYNCHYQQTVGEYALCDGMTAIMMAPRLSTALKAPVKPWHQVKVHPTLGSRTIVRDTRFAHFGIGCYEHYNTMFGRNIVSYDFDFPAYTSGIIQEDVDVNAIAYIERPRTLDIHEEACGDLACDGSNKAMIVDLDGTLFTETRGGTLIPDSGADWSPIPGVDTRRVDPQYQLGYHRVPRELKTTPDGDLIPEEEFVHSRGVPHDDCTYMQAWQAWRCADTDYGMVFWEGLDGGSVGDYLKRRIGPIGVYHQATFTMDIVNGPKTYGLCHGYSCHARATLYPMIVKSCRNIDCMTRIYATSTPPQNSRFHRTTHNPTSKSLMCVYFGGLTRMDVYVGVNQDQFMLPVNGRLTNDGRIAYDRDRRTTHEMRLQEVYDTNTHGANYYSHELKEACFLMKGEEKVTFRLQQVVILALGMPSITYEEFFDEATIVQNVAIFLGVDFSNVRVANAVSEGGSRKRRSEEIIYLTIEIGNHPSFSLVPQLSLLDLDGIYAALELSITNDNLAADLNLGDTVLSGVQLINYIPSVDSDDWATYTNVTEAPTTDPTTTTSTPASANPTDPVATHRPGGPTTTPYHGIDYPYHIDVYMATEVTEGVTFPAKAFIRDKQNNIATDLSGTVTASLEIHDTVNPEASDAELRGIVTVNIVDGVATFGDMFITRPGSNFVLVFTGSPQTLMGWTRFEGLNVVTRQLTSRVLPVQRATVDQHVMLTVQMVDKSNREDVTNLDWRNFIFEAMVDLDPSVEASGAMTGQMLADFDVTTGQATFNLSFSSRGHYGLHIHVESYPTRYNVETYARVEVVQSGYGDIVIEQIVDVEMTFDQQYSTVSGREELFVTAMMNDLDLPDDVMVDNVNLYQGSIIVEFSLAGTNASVSSALDIISEYVGSKCGTKYAGTEMVCDPDSMKVNGKQHDTNQGSEDTVHLAILIVVPIVGILVISGIIVLLVYCFCKPEKEHHLTSQEIQGLKNLMEAASRPSTATSKGSISMMPDFTRENTGFTHKSADQLTWNSQKGEYLSPGERRLSIGDVSKEGTFITLSARADAELDSRPSSAVSRPSSAVSKQDIMTSITPRDPSSARTSFSVPSVGDA